VRQGRRQGEPLSREALAQRPEDEWDAARAKLKAEDEIDVACTL
jgi:hypothetical protein